MAKKDDKRSRDRIRDLDHDVEEEKGDEQWLQLGALIGGAAVVVFLSIALWVQIASTITFHWLPPVENLKSLPGALAHLPQNFADPRLAWPVELQGKIPNRFLFYPIVFALGFVEVKGLLRLRRWWKGRKGGEKESRGGTSWATEKDLAAISDTKKKPELAKGLVLGISEDGAILHLEPQSHALVVAGTRSGKTAGLCIPALLTFEGVVIATSVKDDLVKKTIEQRRKMGNVFIFDPVGALRLPEDETSSWTPLGTSTDWREAQRTANSLIDVAMSQSGGGNMEFFKRMSQQTLPVLLYAAAVMEEDMRRVIRWLYRINDPNVHSEIDSILRWKKNSKALDAWVGFVTKDPKLRGDIAATMASALVSYEDEKVQNNSLTCDITPEKLFDGGMNTLYVVAPMAEQARLEPIFVSLMQGLLMWVTEQPQPLDTPLLAVLDEAANIAALPALPQLLSTLGSQNVQILTSWQDFSQIKGRYHESMNTILNNSRGKLVLPGVADPETIQYFGQITGETIEETVSVSKPTKGDRSVSIGEGRRSLLTPAVIREQEVGEAILVYGQLPPAQISLRMYFKEPELLALANGEDYSAKAKVLAPAAKLKGKVKLPRRG